ncbi:MULTISPECIES: N-acetyldiaminopimelate deacetylase [Leuconostoc]|uniref:N-acetyldiaminopimelate deacetylase n=1 Tax=Leuconostoc suionicum TaxID=1511761 RepID=A0A2N9K999_9LACO|nr:MULTISPECIES: N-acetyldiaminopimelate deacetylase [Leuconostoc]MBE4727086.1 N-acetyldiaminopimelate deacetylase [Leuconostoc suionicum]MDI6522679.1 N-acetyldiaminopimelate deacetylase [Leuconostoc suionicum]MDI6544086.1 N-acetyldiaminopimelate deacetylase [Leuconostoc suionicum]MDI6550377.1 N-acetyldiaminopimelate deacetylase [Leuconostoc suionicum]MDI6613018.1 N-acetyldiaminopimelate deacetylase [Leuconostoc suionicum]
MPVSEEDLKTYRRDLHKIPELALAEFKTHRYLLEKIQSWQTNFMTIRQVEKLPTALLVKFSGTDPIRTIGYRADIDALPVTEDTGLPFESTHKGVMHACGHDVHMSLALGLVQYFSEHQPKDNLIIFFQPAEESKSGGKLAVDLGIFEGDWHPDEFYGIHDQPNLPAGTLSTLAGTLFAGTAELEIDIYGQGGHAAYPHLGKDPIVISAELIMLLQTVVSRDVDPIEGGVVSLGMISGGFTNNVIPDTVHLAGTVRSMTKDGLDKMTTRIRQIVEGVALANDVKINVRLETGSYLPVENNPKLANNLLSFMEQRQDIAFEEAKPAMTGEDFGYILQHIPGVMLWLGVNDNHSLHSAKLNIDEAALLPGFNALKDFIEWRMSQGE